MKLVFVNIMHELYELDSTASISQPPVPLAVPNAVTPKAIETALVDKQTDGRELIAAALEKANTEGKRVLITWGANWCGWCYHLKEQRDTHAGIRALMVERYVAISVDLGNRDRHMALALEYGLDFKNLRIPHMTVLDESGKPAGQKQPTELAVEEGGKTVYSQERILAFVKKHTGSEKGVGVR